MRGNRFGKGSLATIATLAVVAGLAGCQGTVPSAAADGSAARDTRTASTAKDTADPAPEPTAPGSHEPAPPDRDTGDAARGLSGPRTGPGEAKVVLTRTVARRPRPKPPAVMKLDDTDDEVRELEARLVQLELQSLRWLDGYFGTTTRDAVRTFQERHDLRVLGYVDARTWSKLREVTRTPTEEELYPPQPDTGNAAGPLDPRCLSGRVLCVDKSSKTLRWVVDGEVRATLDARFGCSDSPTREGTFAVYSKQRHGYSYLYDSPMPFSLYFDGGQAVHYSSDFNARGYNGCSHGCVNIRDWNGLERVFNEAEVGDKVVVYWS